MQKLIVGMLALIIGACSSPDLSKADEAVAQFHSELNAGKYRAIYRTADPGFRKVSSEADTMKLFDAVHRKLGAYKLGKRTAWRSNYTTSGNNLVVQYKSEFEKADATETFTLIGNDHLRLFGYNIDSSVLITG